MSAGTEGAAAQLRAGAKLGRARRSGLRRGNGPRWKEEGLEAGVSEREGKEKAYGPKREEGGGSGVF